MRVTFFVFPQIRACANSRVKSPKRPPFHRSLPPDHFLQFAHGRRPDWRCNPWVKMAENGGKDPPAQGAPRTPPRAGPSESRDPLSQQPGPKTPQRPRKASIDLDIILEDAPIAIAIKSPKKKAAKRPRPISMDSVDSPSTIYHSVTPKATP